MLPKLGRFGLRRGKIDRNKSLSPKKIKERILFLTRDVIFQILTITKRKSKIVFVAFNLHKNYKKMQPFNCISNRTILKFKLKYY